MSRPWTIRRLARWSGSVLMTVVFALYVLSLFFGVQWTMVRRDRVYEVAIVKGSVVCGSIVGTPGFLDWTPGFRWSAWWNRGHDEFPSLAAAQQLFLRTRPGAAISVPVPLWAPFLLVATPTALLWWSDWHTVRRGLCATCRYDLAGLAAGSACPECGAKGVRG